MTTEKKAPVITTEVNTFGDGKATVTLTYSDGKLKDIGEVVYNPPLDPKAEKPEYAKNAEIFRKKLVD